MKQTSIIIPVYNAERYLENCINSIMQQSYQQFEVILVDDGSTDGSGLLCDRFDASFNQVSVIHTENRGPAAARQTGVQRAAGEYIVFVDADDWLDSDTLRFLMEKEKQTEADILCLGHKETDESGHILSVSKHERSELVLENVTEMMRHLHGTRYIESGPWAKLIKKTLFEDIDFCTDVTIGEDYFMVLQLLENARKIVLYEDALYNRCIRKTSISRSGYTHRHKKAFERYMQWRLYLLEKYPTIKKEIMEYHLEYELAVLTAMCRNKQYDRNVINQLQQDLRKNLCIIVRCGQTPVSMRGSAVLIAYCCPVFIILFRLLHVLTGR